MKDIAILMLLSAIVGQVKPECVHNTRCNEVRGIIKQSGARVSILEKTISRHRWWVITPSNAEGTVLLAFKNFRSLESESVTVHAHKRSGTQETKIFSGAKGNFEIIETDVWNVTINATLGFRENTNFTLRYYGDCEVARENPIIYPDSTRHTNQQSACFIIVPKAQGNVNRVYFTLRNIALPEGVRINMTDVHSSEIISVIDDDQDQVNVAVESKAVDGGTNSFYALLDLTCSSQLCDHTKAEYLASYYAMGEHDIWCIEAQKSCYKKKDDTPRAWCDLACPALNAMSEQEYMLESSLSPSRAEETTIGVENQTVEPSTPTRKRKFRCPSILPQSNCQCDRDPKDDRDFCDPKRRCIRERGCLWRCIVIKFTKCVRVRRFAALVLL